MSKQITAISFTDAGNKGVSIGVKKYNDKGYYGTSNNDYVGLPTKDFNDALQRLKYHLLFLCEFLDATKYTNLPDADPNASFRVCGFTISGAEEKQGIVITGYKTLSNGRGFAFNTPNVRFNEESYPHMQHLRDALEKVREEGIAYLGGKFAMKQTELNLKEETAGQPAP